MMNDRIKEFLALEAECDAHNLSQMVKTTMDEPKREAIHKRIKRLGVEYKKNYVRLIKQLNKGRVANRGYYID